MPRRKSRPGPQAQTVDRAVRILKLIAQNNGEMGVNQIAEALGVYPSVASRLVTTLEYHNLLRQNPQTLKYSLGLGLVELSTTALSSIELYEVSRPVLEELNAETGETVFLMVLDRGEGVYIRKIDSRQKLAIRSEVGRREPAHASAVGKALLAYLPEAEVEEIVARVGLPKMTENTITDLATLKAHLAEVRRRGFAIDNEEGELGIRCIGAPIFDHRGHPVASVSISAPASRVSLEQLLGWSDLLLSGARRISHQLGYRQPQP